MDWKPLPPSFYKIYLSEKYTLGNYIVGAIFFAVALLGLYYGLLRGFSVWYTLLVGGMLCGVLFCANNMRVRAKVVRRMQTDPDSLVYCIAPITRGRRHITYKLDGEITEQKDTKVWVEIDGVEREFDVNTKLYKTFIEYEDVVVVRDLVRGAYVDAIFDGSYIN